MAAEKSRRSDPARTLALLWRSQDPPTRGPKQGLTVDRIVEAAIAVADAEGLATLSMRKVAERLGVGTMSLYTYVPGKAELVHLMYDAVLAEAGPPEGTNWRVALASYARMSRDLFGRHPWAMSVSGAGLLLMGPQLTARANAVYGALTGLDLTASEKAALVNTVDGYVRGVSQLSTDQQLDEGVDYEEWWAQASPALESLITPDRFPALTEIWGAGGFEELPEVGFEFGLQRILDGVEMRASLANKE